MKRKKVITKKNFVYDHYSNGLQVISRSRAYIYFAVALFIFITLVGFMYPYLFEEKIAETINDLVDKTEGLSALGLMRFIITNNIMTSLFGMLSGIFLTVPSIAILLVNAYVLGFVANKSVAIEGIFILWRLFPHGIFELPAVLISLGIGIKLGYEIMMHCIRFADKKAGTGKISLYIFLSLVFLPVSFLIYVIMTLMKEGLREKFFKNVSDALDVFVFVVVPLLVIAGIIEGILIWGFG